MKKLLLFLVSFLIPMVTYGYDFKVDGIYYNIISSTELTVSVTNSGVKDKAGNISGKEYTGDIVIPDEVIFSERKLKVIDISSYAFNESNIESIALPNSLKNISRSAFEASKKLKEVTIPTSVESIGSFAFGGCSSLKKVIIEDSDSPLGIDVTNSYAGIFRLCPLEELFIGRDIERIISHDGGSSWNDNNLSPFGFHQLKSDNLIITIGPKVKSLCDRIFKNAKGLTIINIPETVESIGKSAFEGCSQLKEVHIPSKLTEIPNYAFCGCESLETIILPNSVKTIEFCAFMDCSSLKSVNLGENMSLIENAAFKSCSSLEIITLPQSLVKIGEFAFDQCGSLISITSMSYTPPQAVDNSFSTMAYWNATLLVPYGTKSLYEAMACWKNFSNITEDTSNVAKYNLCYWVDGEEYKSYEILYGANITPEPFPTKEGYTFSGWSEIPETMPAHDVIITGIFTINKYKLIYMVDGEEYKSFEIEYNSSITPEAEPTKDGYKFSGWSEIPETMPAHDVTITGSFERVYSGGDVANLIDLLLFGNVDDEDIALYDMNGDGELNIGDLILIMRAAQNNSRNRSAANRAAENQSIEFAADIVTMKPGETSALNISLSSSISGIYGIQFEVNLPEGFSLEKGSNDKIYEMSANQVDDITCNDRDLGNGTYRFFIYSSTLQELKGGSLMSLNLKADADKTLGNYSVSISNVAMSDYDGHVTKEEGSSVGVKVTNTFTLLYQVDGEDYKSYEIEYGESITPEAEPTKEGYTFSGWSEIPETMPAENVIVKGTFTVNQYILTYVVDGEVYKEYSYDYGSAITPEAEPTKEGYTFSGWSEIPETMPAKEVYVVGTFTINKYKITYVIDGEVYLTEEVEYGSWITPPNPDDHEGYDFAWEDYPDTMPAHDITINGAYTPTGIEAILASEPDVKIYTVSGKPLNKVQKGVNILRYKDGRTRKIVVK